MQTRLPREGHVQVVVPASPAQVWAVLTDVTRVGEWSHECHTARWLPGPGGSGGGAAGGAAIGARFQGENKAGRNRWARVCTITELEPVRRFGYVTSGGRPPDSTRWTVELEPGPDGGTVIHQSFEVLAISRLMELVIVALVPAHRDRTAALGEDLVRLGALAAS